MLADIHVDKRNIKILFSNHASYVIPHAILARTRLKLDVFLARMVLSSKMDSVSTAAPVDSSRTLSCSNVLLATDNVYNVMAQT